MKIRRVRAGARYIYNPVLMDRTSPALSFAIGTCLKPGDVVRVINLPGAPKANTMGQCHIETEEGVFAGMVCCNSLVPVREWKKANSHLA
jgi:hypothetical protein